MEDKYSKIKILRKNGRSEKIFIDNKEIKGVTGISISNSTTDDVDATFVVIKIGFIESLEMVGD